MLDRIAPYHGRRVNVIVETPRGSRNKFDFQPEFGVFRLGRQLPAGAVFPFDFGFIPSTRAGDGDPIDALVLLDAPTFPGCLVRARMLGVIEGRQTGRSGKVVDNPRLITVATKSNEFDAIRTLADLPTPLVDEIEHFFVSHNAAAGKVFEPTGRRGPGRARDLVAAALRSGASSKVPRACLGEDRARSVVAGSGRLSVATASRTGS